MASGVRFAIVFTERRGRWVLTEHCLGNLAYFLLETGQKSCRLDHGFVSQTASEFEYIVVLLLLNSPRKNCSELFFLALEYNAFVNMTSVEERDF